MAVGIALALRAGQLQSPVGPDEAGLLQVAHQWSSGGGSLYGQYWVDRPPLLVAIFAVADAAGGVLALRLLGCAAVGIAVLACAATARRLAGDVAASWTAVVAASLLVAPQVGTGEVNAELLAAPFVALGLLGLVSARQSTAPARAGRRAAAGGMAATAAILVKQNTADVFVFAAILGLLSLRSPAPRTAGRRAICAGFLAGAAAAAAAVGAWAVLHGTALVDLGDALYGFRVQAAHVLATEGGTVYAQARAITLADRWVGSGLALLTLAIAASVRQRARDPALTALAVLMVFDLVSVASGGNYWLHYLVQLVVPLAVASGVLAARAVPAAQAAALATVGLTSAAAMQGILAVPATSASVEVGAAVARSGQSGDTLTTLYGDPRINLAAGLRSPYPHLWSLPIKTLDPRLRELDAILTGPRAPTWLVVRGSVASWGLSTDRTAALIGSRYRQVADCAGVRIFLHQDVARRRPTCPHPASSARR